MKPFARFLSLLLSLLLLAASAAADSKPKAREITADVVQEIPEIIQQVLDKAYDEWLAADAQELKECNQYTEWRGAGYKFGWCGGFITKCMLVMHLSTVILDLELLSRMLKG